MTAQKEELVQVELWRHLPKSYFEKFSIAGEISCFVFS